MAGADGAYNRGVTKAVESEAEPGPIGLSPASPVTGPLRIPGSKSVGQRALLGAALAEGATVLRGLPGGEDVAACLQLVEDCGVTVYRSAEDRVLIEGRPPHWDAGLEPEGPLQVGESGTLARLATAALALCATPGVPVTIAVRGTLLLRRSPALFRALEDAGLEITRQNVPGGWPVAFVVRRPPSCLVIHGPGSSQEVTALLLVAAALGDGHEVLVHGPIPSRPYVTLTRRVLAWFGVQVIEDEAEVGSRFRVVGRLRAPREPRWVEPDASAAAVGLVAACLSDGALRIEGLTADSAQGDVRIVEHLASFGCRAAARDDGLRAQGFPQHGAQLDLTGEPDLAPPLAAVAAGAALRHGARTTLGGLGTLPGKESDRIAVLAQGLGRLGFAVEAGDDFLTVGPPAAGVVPDQVLDPHGDHRMAFAFALCGLLVPGVRVDDPGCVAKSWAGFWSDMEGAGAVLDRGPA